MLGRSLSNPQSAVRNPHSPGAERRAFTLIELLTVIAILGILAAILIPTLGRVRGSARTAQSLSNLRQIGVAAQLYMDENKGWMPDDGDGNPNNTGTAGQPATVPWYNALPPYVGEKSIQEMNSLGSMPGFSAKSIFVCPRAAEKSNRADSYAWRSYAPTWLIDANASGSGSGVPTNRSMVKDPTRTVMFSETTFHTAYDVTSPTPDYVSTANPNFLRNDGAQRHDGKALVGFFDGSVRSFNAAQLLQQYNERNTPGASVRWNPKL
jgi:general secretion pathway protein G